jgi:hypothetical protein
VLNIKQELSNGLIGLIEGVDEVKVVILSAVPCHKMRTYHVFELKGECNLPSSLLPGSEREDKPRQDKLFNEDKVFGIRGK